MSTCNRLHLQKLGSQPIMAKNLPDHWCKCGMNLDDGLRVDDVFIWVAFLGLYRKVGICI